MHNFAPSYGSRTSGSEPSSGRRTGTEHRLKSFAVLLLILNSTSSFLHNYADAFLLASTIFTACCWVLMSGRLKSSFAFFLGGISGWLLLTSVYHDVFNIYTLVGFYVRLLFPFLVVMLLARQYFDIFDRWVVRLTGLSLVAFSLSLIVPGVFLTLSEVAGPLFVFRGESAVQGLAVGGWDRLNLGFFTFAPDIRFRNHGFMWEPGALGVILNVTLALQLVRGKERFDWQKVILILGILSTVSTTGYIALIVNAAYWISRRRGWGPVVSLFCMAAAGVGSTYVGFLLPKLISEFQLGADYAERGVNWTLTRYASFVFDSRDFLDHPLLGRGIFMENRYTGHLFLPSNNGLSDFAVRYGVFGIVVVLFNLGRSIFKVSGHAAFGTMVVIAVILLGGWSERYFELPFFVALLYMHYLWDSGRRAVHARHKRPNTVDSRFQFSS